MKLTREQTETIIKNGQKRGLSGTDVLNGLISKGFEPEGIDVNQVKSMMASKSQEVAPEETKQNTFERVKEGIEKKGEEVVDILNDPNKNALEKGVGATAKAFSAISSTAYNSMPDDIRNTLDKVGGGIGKGFEWLTDKISNSKFLQEAMSGDPNNTKGLESALRIASDLGLISGEILLADQAKNAGKFADKALEKTGEVIVDTTKKGISTVKELMTNPKELISKVSDSNLVNKLQEKFTTLDPKVKNILETANSEKFERYVKAGEEALKDPRKLTPLEQSGELVTNKVLPAIKEDLARIGAQKTKTLSSIGTKKAPGIATEAIDYIRGKTQSMKLTPAERKLVNNVVSELEKLGKNPTLISADKTVDLLQSMFFEKAKGMAIPVTSRVKGLVNQTIGKLNGSVKTVAREALKSEEYSLLNDAYALRVKIFGEINKALGTEGIKGGALLKRFFSPSDAGIKKMFAKIKEIYGVDLAEDAVLAKFVMESLGDGRASSLLDLVPKGTTDAIGKVFGKVKETIEDPISKARSVIKKRGAPKIE